MLLLSSRCLGSVHHHHHHHHGSRASATATCTDSTSNIEKHRGKPHQSQTHGEAHKFITTSTTSAGTTPMSRQQAPQPPQPCRYSQCEVYSSDACVFYAFTRSIYHATCSLFCCCRVLPEYRKFWNDNSDSHTQPNPQTSKHNKTQMHE